MAFDKVFKSFAPPAPVVKKEDPKPREGYCTVPGCDQPLAPGQNYVCTKHVRSN